MNTRPRKWVLIATIDEHGYGSYGPSVPFSRQNPHELTISRITVRRVHGRRKHGRAQWKIWGVPA